MRAAAVLVIKPIGYASETFAEACRDYGRPRRLRSCGASVLLREINGTPFIDAMGCYPLFACQHWDRLADNLGELEHDCVSLVLVSDPFSPLGQPALETIFDRVVFFKNHYVADLTVETRDFVSAKRLRSGRSLLRRMRVEVVRKSAAFVDEWLQLQRELQDRHGSRATRPLTREAMADLFATPGVTVLRATLDDALMGIHVDILAGGVVYAHLAAYSRAGYAANASSAINIFEIEFFRDKARWIDWGGNAGSAEDANDGLALFKSRFSTGSLPVYLCGKIFQHARYDELVRALPGSNRAFFPAYRAGDTA